MIFNYYQTESIAHIKEGFQNGLSKLMEYTKLSTNFLAKQLKMNQQTIYRYKIGKNEPTLTQAVNIASYFEINLITFIQYGYESAEKDITDIFEDSFIYKLNNADINDRKEIIENYKIKFPKVNFEEIIKEKMIFKK